MRRICLLLLICTLAACGSKTATIPATNAPAATTAPAPTTAPTATTAPTTAPTATTAPAPTSAPTATTAPTSAPSVAVIPTEELAGLAATAAAQVPPTPAPANAGDFTTGIDGVQAIPLTGAGAGLAVIYTTGLRTIDPQQNHYVAIYNYEEHNWNQITRFELENPDSIIDVSQVQVAPGKVWLAVQSGVGAHSGCLDLLSFDGKTLTNEANACNSSPGGSGVTDIDGDGIGEVLLDATNYYVSCYACGIRYFSTQVLRWNGSKLVETDYLPVQGAPELTALAEQAVTLAKVGLWKDALPLAAKLREQGKGNADAIWDAALIEVRGKPFEAQANDTNFTPITNKLFYGDYAAIIAYIRTKPVADLFKPEQSRIFGEEMNLSELAMPDYITTTVEPVLALNPKLAEAQFLEGWALALADPKDPKAVAAFEQAVALDSKNKFYQQVLEFVRKRQA